MKAATLLAFLGGPLWLADSLHRSLGEVPAFIIGATPVMLLLFGFVGLHVRSYTWSSSLVRLGYAGTALLAVVNIAATRAVLNERLTLEGVIVFGILCGTIASAVFVVLARRVAQASMPNPFSLSES